MFNSTEEVTENCTLSIEEEEAIKLAEIQNAALEQKLVKELKKNPKYRKLIAAKKMSVGVVDMKNQNQPRFASVNGDNMMYAASLPKIAVLLAAMEAIDEGSLKLTPAVEKDMNLMIRKSNNAASTRMIDRVGYEKIASVMQDERYQLYDKENGGGLWVGKRYAAQGRRFPDPVKGLSHAASADAVCNYYYMLAQKELVSPEMSDKMMEVLVNPGLHHKFVNTLDRIAPNATIYRKSGSWKSYHSDSVWVQDDKRDYILVALIDDNSGEQIARDLVHVAERALEIEPNYLASKK